MLLLDHNGVREKLNHSLRVLFCIASPSHCVRGQFLIDKSVIRNFWSTSPQISDPKSGALTENRIPHPNRSFFLRGFLVTRRCADALAFPLLLVDEKVPTIHGDRITIFLKKSAAGAVARPLHPRRLKIGDVKIED